MIHLLDFWAMLTQKILLVKSVSPVVDNTHLSWMNTKHGNKTTWIPEVGGRCFPEALTFSFIIQGIAWTISLCNLFLSSLHVCTSSSSSRLVPSYEDTEEKNSEAAPVAVWEAFDWLAQLRASRVARQPVQHLCQPKRKGHFCSLQPQQPKFWFPRKLKLSVKEPIIIRKSCLGSNHRITESWRL